MCGAKRERGSFTSCVGVERMCMWCQSIRASDLRSAPSSPPTAVCVPCHLLIPPEYSVLYCLNLHINNPASGFVKNQATAAPSALYFLCAPTVLQLASLPCHNHLSDLQPSRFTHCHHQHPRFPYRLCLRHRLRFVFLIAIITIIFVVIFVCRCRHHLILSTLRDPR